METTTPTLDAQITLSDLAAVKTCIEIAASRGAYRAEEMRSVGQAYDRLAEFLKSAQPVSDEQPETQQGA